MDNLNGKKLVVPSHVTFTNLPDEGILLDLEKEHFYGLNEIGILIWQLLSEKVQTVDAIVSRIVSQYDVSQEQAKHDVLRLIEKLVSRGLLEIQG